MSTRSESTSATMKPSSKGYVINFPGAYQASPAGFLERRSAAASKSSKIGAAFSALTVAHTLASQSSVPKAWWE